MASQIAVSVCRLGVEADIQGFYNGKIFASSLFAYLVTGTSYTCFRCELSPHSNFDNAPIFGTMLVGKSLQKVILLQKAGSNSYLDSRVGRLCKFEFRLLPLVNIAIIAIIAMRSTKTQVT